jgi:serine protease AprX
MKKLLWGILLSTLVQQSSARALVDGDVWASLNEPDSVMHALKAAPQFLSVLIFLKSPSDTEEVMEFLHDLGVKEANQLEFMPVIVAVVEKNKEILTQIAEHTAVAQITTNHAGSEELELSAQSILLAPSPTNPDINNWWDHGYTGQQGVIGLIDSGVANKHASLANKKIIVRKEPGSGYDDFPDGIRSAHGTGIACIYAGVGTNAYPHDVGIANGAHTIVTGLAGEGVGEAKDLFQTYSTINWMLTQSEVMPTIINYSFGNGKHDCATCPDWSGLAKTVDYVINQHKIMWIKSAGNLGYIDPHSERPYASTLTIPADNYNGLTVANMSPSIFQDGVTTQTSDRQLHSISARSSRGPTINGRKKPDLTAPGDNTWTCAPDPEQYAFDYTEAMHYKSGYRLMGGTSSAAPHVGAAILLMQDAGIVNPMLEKALLINSADAWTDNNLPGPHESVIFQNSHYPVEGSEWNRTYGWGYINLQKAFDEREHLLLDKLDIAHPIKTYEAVLPLGAKVTLVHERRVGYMAEKELGEGKEKREWMLSPLSLEIVDAETQQVLQIDDSQIDSVHQVAHCERKAGERKCSSNTKTLKVLIRVSLRADHIEGSDDEPFALAASAPFKPVD